MEGIKGKSIQEVIDIIKSGQEIQSEELKLTVLALSSMFTKSRMTLENIASHIGNETNIHTAARCLLGNLSYVRKERSDWLSSNAHTWLQINIPNYEETQSTT